MKLAAAASCFLALGAVRRRVRRTTSTAREPALCSRRPSRRSERILAAVARLTRWEYWPAWVLYLPLLPWIGVLALRYRGFGTVSAANPGIPGGGFVGESKAAILDRLRGEAVLDSVLLPPDGPAVRAARLLETMRAQGYGTRAFELLGPSRKEVREAAAKAEGSGT